MSLVFCHFTRLLIFVFNYKLQSMNYFQYWQSNMRVDISKLKSYTLEMLMAAVENEQRDESLKAYSVYKRTCTKNL